MEWDDDEDEADAKASWQAVTQKLGVLLQGMKWKDNTEQNLVKLSSGLVLKFVEEKGK